MLVEQGTELLYNEIEVRNILATYSQSLGVDFENLKFNKSYIGQKEGLLEGQDVKYTVSMEVFLVIYFRYLMIQQLGILIVNFMVWFMILEEVN